MNAPSTGGLLRRAARRILGRAPSSGSVGTGAGAVAGPDAVEVGPRWLRVGDGYTATLAITGYPAEVGAGWLEPLLSYPGRLDVALHIDPLHPATAAKRLRTQQGRLESTRRSAARDGKLDDPETEAAAADAADMALALARGESKLFRVGLYLTVHAPTREDLDADIAEVRSLASSLLLDAQPAAWRSVQGWTSTLPLGVDLLGVRRTLDTPALAASFPFTSPDLPAVDPSPHAPLTGRLYGVNASSNGLVLWDRWGQDNYNSVTLARSGAGKSYFTKLEALRSLYPDPHRPTPEGEVGVQVFVIDPEDEYQRLTEAVGGTYLHLGAPGVRLNPLDLPPGAQRIPDALTRRSLFIHTLLAVMLGEPLSPQERAVLDRAVTATYARVGITADRRTWTRPAPLLADLADALDDDSTETGDPAGTDLAARLTPYVSGSFSGLFDGPTTRSPDGHLVAISLRDLPDELKSVGTLIALDAVWRRVLDPHRRRRRLVVVDEAWLLMHQPEAAKFLYRLAKSARKYWAGLAFVSQDAGDVLSSDLGKAIVSNASTQVLLRQSTQAIDTIADAFRLSEGERAYLLAAGPGEALLLAGTSRVAFHALASDEEDTLITTDPQALAGLDAGEEDDLEP
ncbi:conjugal transfer protein TraC [Amycolatopsis sp. K13G38]|uniref:Conjugal transfer protein TraC n=1 Tax=Amycolatopsis acididurans TaxID=2724524 RepID=A0ABX1IXG5_9PSEU|nr:ATP-binding protein [Amycolatopsis acididurans]NKQ52004.1 conjugal transfer protein TraC [Amycolatopsis acididurans]